MYITNLVVVVVVQYDLSNLCKFKCYFVYWELLRNTKDEGPKRKLWTLHGKDYRME